MNITTFEIICNKIIEEIREKGISSIPYDAFIYNECIKIIINNIELYKKQISDDNKDGCCYENGANLLKHLLEAKNQ